MLSKVVGSGIQGVRQEGDRVGPQSDVAAGRKPLVCIEESGRIDGERAVSVLGIEAF